MIESYQLPPRVNFNPNNPQHAEALAWMLFYGRQHPTLRFNFDPRKYANAFEMMLCEFIQNKLPKGTLERIEQQVHQRPLLEAA